MDALHDFKLKPYTYVDHTLFIDRIEIDSMNGIVGIRFDRILVKYICLFCDREIRFGFNTKPPTHNFNSISFELEIIYRMRNGY